jgi:hypothetical protein
MTPQEIIDLIRSRIESAEHNEQQSLQEYLQATTDAERDAARNGSQISTGQRLVLQSILDEIEE